FFQAEDGIRDRNVTGVQTCALPILERIITLPITELFTGKPHFFSDNAFHWYQIRAGLNLAENGHIVGYDPYFNAGYAVGVTSGISSKGALLATIFLRNFFDEIVAYKLYVFISAVIAPVFVCLALYWVG